MTTPDSQRAGVPTTASVAASVPEPEKGASIQEIEADIERTRNELGATVENLAERLDVKARAKHQVDKVKTDVAARVDDARDQAVTYAHQAKDALTDPSGKPNRTGWITVGVAAAVIGLVLFGVVRRGRA
ncbi:DUF3618 domain-containing protein [Microbacterium sp. 179-B 1A2 NHS]|uniref:DUF3618 domain-containing protein n=1 Tax=Microbacterium sp. 179-B 1A2 NHS TaxID=3142383 RepID=UPI0039A28000